MKENEISQMKKFLLVKQIFKNKDKYISAMSDKERVIPHDELMEEFYKFKNENKK